MTKQLTSSSEKQQRRTFMPSVLRTLEKHHPILSLANSLRTCAPRPTIPPGKEKMACRTPNPALPFC